ncbi:MAG: hypothetical protein ABI455_02410 [Candidatus Dormiibacterota bacterium]
MISAPLDAVPTSVVTLRQPQHEHDDQGEANGTDHHHDRGQKGFG